MVYPLRENRLIEGDRERRGLKDAVRRLLQDMVCGEMPKQADCKQDLLVKSGPQNILETRLHGMTNEVILAQPAEQARAALLGFLHRRLLRAISDTVVHLRQFSGPPRGLALEIVSIWVPSPVSCGKLSLLTWPIASLNTKSHGVSRRATRA